MMVMVVVLVVVKVVKVGGLYLFYCICLFAVVLCVI